MNDEALGGRLNTASSYHHLGIIATTQGDLDKARVWHERSLAVGKLDEAGFWCDKALVLSKELGNYVLTCSTYFTLSTIAAAREDLDKAQNYGEEAVRLAEQVGDRQVMTLSYGVLGVLTEAQGDPARALDWTVRAASLLSDGSQQTASSVPEQLTRLAIIQGMSVLEESW